MATYRVIDGYDLRSDDKTNVFDAACGLYWHCANYHEGQGSERYRILSTLDYYPGACESGPEAESTSQDIYNALASGELTVEDVEAFVRDGLDNHWEDESC